MDPGILAKRRALALQGIQEKASSLSEKASIEKEYNALIGSLNMRKHEPDLTALFLVEGVHAFLTKLDEELEESSAGEEASSLEEAIRKASDEELGALEGIGDQTVKKLRESYGKS